MRNTKLLVALGAAAALSVTPLAASSAFAADSAASNTGTSAKLTAGVGVAKADGMLKKCKKYAKPTKKYKKGTKLVDLSGIADFTPVTTQDGVTFTPTMEKRSVPGSWGTWGAPDFTESATPNILYSAGATSVNVNFGEASKKGGFEVEPNPFSVHTFHLVFMDGAKAVCTIDVDADGSSGARLAAVKVKGGGTFDNVTVSSDVDFAIAQVRHDPA